MHSIDPSKITTEVTKPETESRKEINNKVNPSSANKDRLAIGQLLKQTLPHLSQNGLLSVNTQKAMLNAKQILPAAYTQIYIQDKIEQHKIIEATKSTSVTITPKQLTHGTIKNWVSGQIIQAVVYQETQNGLAKLLVSPSGQFDTKALSQILPQTTSTQIPGSSSINIEQTQVQIKVAIETLDKVVAKLAQAQISASATVPVQNQTPAPAIAPIKTETPQTQIKAAADILNKVVTKLAQPQISDPVQNQTPAPAIAPVKIETPQTQIKAAADILNKVVAKLAQPQTSAPVQNKTPAPAIAPVKIETPQVQVKAVADILHQVIDKLSPIITSTTQDTQSKNNILANTTINHKIIQQSQLVQINTKLPLSAGQQILLYVNKKSGEVSFQIQHQPSESHKISQYLNQHTLKQQALPQLLASLKDISSQINQTTSPFTPQFVKQVDSLLKEFPQLTDLSTVKAIKNILINSGQFLENKLFTSVIQSMNLTDSPAKPITSSLMQQLSQTDIKANLAQLVAMIQKNEALILSKGLTTESNIYKNIEHKTLFDPHTRIAQTFELPNRVAHAQVQLPIADANLLQLNSLLMLQSKVLDQLEGVLSRIIATQLNARETRTDQVHINIEIPFRSNDQQEVLQLKIREEKQDFEAEKGNKIWTVNMAFHLPSLGGIRIYMTLDKQELAMQFWTEESSTQKLFQSYFPLLAERLYAAGFSISQLSAFHGIPEAAREEQQSSQFIIDERV